VSAFAGLDLLATAVVALDDAFVVRYANPAAENLFATGAKSLIGQAFLALFTERADLEHTLDEARVTHWDYSAQNVTFSRPGRDALTLSCVVTRIEAAGLALIVELRPIDEQLRQAREERLVSGQESNRELIRNLAHEIKNPLGGLRGSAQLLERELDRPELREYTQVIIKEADRLQGLMDRMLVRAESGLEIQRDYDPSIPEIIGDREQLIQAALNIARNSVQAGARNIIFRTRSLRQITVMKHRHKLALELQVIDDGPGVPDEIRERIFNPLVSGREGGTGLGLSLAQTFVQYHQGVVEFESRPGRTIFRILLPLT
jgi:two-component system nitrogen regulation sensor histidine kinase GlnL